MGDEDWPRLTGLSRQDEHELPAQTIARLAAELRWWDVDALVAATPEDRRLLEAWVDGDSRTWPAPGLVLDVVTDTQLSQGAEPARPSLRERVERCRSRLTSLVGSCVDLLVDDNLDRPFRVTIGGAEVWLPSPVRDLADSLRALAEVSPTGPVAHMHSLAAAVALVGSGHSDVTGRLRQLTADASPAGEDVTQLVRPYQGAHGQSALPLTAGVSTAFRGLTGGVAEALAADPGPRPSVRTMMGRVLRPVQTANPSPLRPAGARARQLLLLAGTDMSRS